MTAHSKYATGIGRGMILAVGAGAMLASTIANATVIVGVQPEQQTVNVGDTVTADVRAATTNGEAIGSHEIDLNFDSSVLDVASVDFSGNFGVSRTDSSLSAGTVNASEATLELPSTLEQQQPADEFSLFTVDFTATAVGESVLGGEFQALDPFGRLLGQGQFSDQKLPGGRLADAEIEVTADDDPAEVPVPGSVWLLAVGLLGGLMRRRR